MIGGKRIEAAIAGREVDRIPWALWRHFPGGDQTAEGLAESVVRFQRRWEFDLVKVTPTNGLFAEAWGGKMGARDHPEGTRAYVRFAVRDPEEWLKLEPLSVEHPLLQREIRALSLIRAELGNEIPIFQTFFSPLAVARNMAGDEALVRHFREARDALARGLEVIQRSMMVFAEACLKAGADSAFFAVNTANPRFFSVQEYEEFGLAFDRALVHEIRDRARFVLLHLHGEGVYFDLFRDFPADIFNWHDRRTAPNLKDGLARIQGAALGGLNEWGPLLRGPPEAIRAEVDDAIGQTGGRRLILGAGCVLPVTVPEEHLAEVKARLG